MFPTIAEYNKAIQSRGILAFRTLKDITFIPSRTVPVRIYSYGSGSYAVVFKGVGTDKEYAIRCFISAEHENIERYRRIAKYLEGLSPGWLTHFEFIEDEIEVNDTAFPVIKMEWLDGLLLNNYISLVLNEPIALTELQEEIVQVSASLEALKVGHGDIQCGNVIITKNDSGKTVLRLIDYDGMYIPEFANKVNLERGRTEFQHPGRSSLHFDEKIDRFSFWVIICALEAIKTDPSLWQEIMQGGFNTLDNVLFTGEDFRFFHKSKLVKKLYGYNQPALTFYLNRIYTFLQQGTQSVEAPYLAKGDNLNEEPAIISENPLSFETPENHAGGANANENAVFGGKSESDNGDNPGDSEISIISHPAGAAVMDSTFRNIGVTPLRIKKADYLGKKLVVAYGTQIKQCSIIHGSSKIELSFDNLKNNNGANFDGGNVNKPTYAPPQSKSTFIYPDKTLGSTSLTKRQWAMLTAGAIAFIVISFGFFIKPGEQKKEYSGTTDSLTSPGTAPAPYADYRTDTVPFNKLDSRLSDRDNADEIGNTAYETIRIYFRALQYHECGNAWQYTYIPEWEQYGKDWFCADTNYGALDAANIIAIYPNPKIKQTKNRMAYRVESNMWLSGFGDYLYTQRFTMEKTTFDSTTRWVIVGIENISTPIPYNRVAKEE